MINSQSRNLYIHGKTFPGSKPDNDEKRPNGTRSTINTRQTIYAKLVRNAKSSHNTKLTYNATLAHNAKLIHNSKPTYNATMIHNAKLTYHTKSTDGATLFNNYVIFSTGTRHNNIIW